MGGRSRAFLLSFETYLRVDRSDLFFRQEAYCWTHNQESSSQKKNRYHAGMPWPAVPYDEPFREDFASRKGVNSVPRLVVTGKRGQELASNAVGMTWEQLVAWEAQE